MKTKEGVIKEAWGKNYEEFKDYIDSDGWARYPHFQKHEMIEDVRPIEFRSQGTDFRPKSLQGIESNNGWICVESEADLPKEYGEYYFRTTYNTMITYSGWYSSSDKKFYDSNHYFEIIDVTHYQPIIKPKSPIY